MSLIEDGKIDPSFIITDRVSLDEEPQAYKDFRDKAHGCVKVVMHPHAMARDPQVPVTAARA
jgi:threonine dehydrogenase-like Zn-dependent dehydrogenase